MKAIHESIVEVLIMLKFFVKNTVFYPKMGEDEQIIGDCHCICVVHIEMYIVCEYDVNISHGNEMTGNVKVWSVNIQTHPPTYLPTYPYTYIHTYIRTYGNHHRIGSACSDMRAKYNWSFRPQPTI